MTKQQGFHELISLGRLRVTRHVLDRIWGCSRDDERLLIFLGRITIIWLSK
jgi:hypothetical protein